MRKSIITIVILIPSIVIAAFIIAVYLLSTNYFNRQINKRYQKNIIWQINTNPRVGDTSVDNNIWINRKHHILLALCGRKLCAYSIPSGQLLYSYQPKEHYRFHFSTELNDDLVIYRSNTEIVVIDVKSGDVKWSKAYPDEAFIGSGEIFNSDRGAIGNQQTLIVYRNEVGSSPFVPIFDGFNINTGELLWTFKPITYSFGGIHAKVVNDKLIIGNDYGDMSIYNVSNGSLEVSSNLNAQEIYPATNNNDYLIARIGTNALKGFAIYDLNNNTPVWSEVRDVDGQNIYSVCFLDERTVVALEGGILKKSEVNSFDLTTGSRIGSISLPTEAEALYCNDGYAYAASRSSWPRNSEGSIYILDISAGNYVPVTFSSEILPYRISFNNGSIYVPSQDGRLYRYTITNHKLRPVFGLLHEYVLRQFMSNYEYDSMGMPESYNGITYVKGADGYLYALSDTSK